MTTSALRPVTVKIEPSVKLRVQRLAKARHRTPHWVMHEAILQFVEREEKREAFRQDAIKAWDEYRLTGLHVTAAEADAWMAKLEAGQDVEPPECHG
jgi:predicted transcriptional regulator